MNNEFFQRMHERDQRKMPVNQALKAKLAKELKLERSQSWFKWFFGWMGSHARPVGGLALASALVLAISLGMNRGGSLPTPFHFGPVTDDWQYGGTAVDSEKAAVPTIAMQQVTGLSNAGAPAGLVTGGNAFTRMVDAFQNAAAPSPMALTAPSVPSSRPMMRAYESAADASLGFAVGGAKDIGSFRENIKNGFLPSESDITYEGLFYDYSFDTGQRQGCNELFCPSYARALVRNPVTNQDETYLSVGLNSNIKESDFKRQKTNFVVVLDISGSMGSPFDQYYYDGQGKRIEVPQAEASKSKMQLANESVSALVDQLKPDDRLGIVVFSDEAKVAKPLGLVGEVDRAALKRHIMQLQATNGTNMSAGLEEGTKLLSGPKNKMLSSERYANRIIFITDAMPNEGEFGADGLRGLIERYERQGIQTTLMGIGVDFQTELVEALTKVRGANYLSIHSAQEFKKRLGEDFDYLVSPLVYDLRLNFQGSGYAIDEIYGSPDADLSSGEMLHVRTLFPSKTENGETKGGLVLLKLRKTSENSSVKLHASYEDVNGGQHTNEANVSFSDLSAGAFDNLGVRKGVLLVQYAHLLKDWTQGERTDARAIGAPGNTNWERGSQPLRVSEATRQLFKKFSEYFSQEVRAIGDTTLDREQQVLNQLSTTVNPPVVWPINNPPAGRPMPMDDWRY
jgi:Ca-activated chloride channel family protein